MNEKKYTYIQDIGNGKHLIQDDYLTAHFPSKVSIRVAEEAEIGIKLNELTLQVISSYPQFLRKK